VGDPEAALAELGAARGRRRLLTLDPFDAFYRAYLAGISVVVVAVVGAGFLPEGQVTAATARQVAEEGPALAGVVLALAVAVGLRSGGRGGPLALQPAEVNHVLLAPLPRSRPLRAALIRQLRFGAFVGAGAGAAAGLVAAGRLPGGAPAFMAAGMATAVLTAVTALGAAAVLSGRRRGMLAADAVAVVVVGLSVVDVLAGTRLAPATWLGTLALAPVELDPLALAGGAMAVACAAGGLAAVAGTSLEAALRRAGLVGELRFAVTLQDLRTVLLLRRQLAQEQPRTRPWVRLRPGPGVVVRRDLRGLARFPAVRIVRMLALGAAAGAALRGMWSGTTPLLILAALCLFLAALDAIDPLGQDVDRPDRWGTFPVPDGKLLLRHLIVPTAAMVLVGLVGLGTAAALGPSALVAELAGVILPLAAFAAVVAATGSVVMGPADNSKVIASPEAAGIGLVGRAAWPPALVALALAPLLAARSAVADGLPPVATAANVAFLAGLPVAGAVWWISFRKASRS